LASIEVYKTGDIDKNSSYKISGFVANIGDSGVQLSNNYVVVSIASKAYVGTGTIIGYYMLPTNSLSTGIGNALVNNYYLITKAETSADYTGSRNDTIIEGVAPGVSRVENKGQLDGRLQYLVDVDGYTVYDLYTESPTVYPTLKTKD
jgi:hypothetical protein